MTGVVVRTNLPDFKRQLTALGVEFERKAVRSSTLAAASVLRAAVKRQIISGGKPQTRTGALMNAVYVKRSRRSTRGAERYFVGVRGKTVTRKRKGQTVTQAGAFYWRFLEGGWIARGPGQKISGGERTRSLKRERLRASGAKFYRYPFIQPAFEEARGQATDVFFRRMAAQINKLNAKR